MTSVAAHEIIGPFRSQVKRPARGLLRHDYLVPGGPYEEQWDWDAFFMGVALLSDDPKEAIYLRNWALNYIENAREDGFSPGLVTSDGPDWRLNHMKPFLAQGCVISARVLQDWQWIAEADRYQRLRAIVLYREEHGFFFPNLGLAAWTNSMESGADNNVALLDFPDRSVAATDVNSFLFLEYRSMSLIAKELGHTQDARLFAQKAEALRTAILRLWNAEDGAFENIDVRDGSWIRVIGYSSFHPFWAGIATKGQAETFFTRYALNPDELWSPYGIRTLTKRDPRYNNANIIKPHSNWQGPVWPIGTYIAAQSLARYGQKEEAMAALSAVTDCCLRDIAASGGMHENYDAETGLPLAAPNFISWNLLLINALDELRTGSNPFAID